MELAINTLKKLQIADIKMLYYLLLIIMKIMISTRLISGSKNEKEKYHYPLKNDKYRDLTITYGKLHHDADTIYQNAKLHAPFFTSFI